MTSLERGANPPALQDVASWWSPGTADFAFAFDIDGVLLRGKDPVPNATKALRFLHQLHLPFVFITNGGGRLETDRIKELEELLDVQLDPSVLVQTHSPFAALDDFKGKTNLVVGGESNACREVASSYGFDHVITPCDIYAAYPDVWPFSDNLSGYHRANARALRSPILFPPSAKNLTIDGGIFVFSDSKDWGLDAQLIIDLLLSHKGVLGTRSSLNGNSSLENYGYQQDGQPPLFFSNPDLLWSTSFGLPRLGQGGFGAMLEGIWTKVTQGPKKGVKLQSQAVGKPSQTTFQLAEQHLLRQREINCATPLKTVYMVGDNPESDILGAKAYRSPFNTVWKTLLVQTGMFSGTHSTSNPDAVVAGAYEAVLWALSDASPAQGGQAHELQGAINATKKTGDGRKSVQS
ncbi:MAG: hypothetical protein Q9198_004531 [Flavoplaca austrocitrina]